MREIKQYCIPFYYKNTKLLWISKNQLMMPMLILFKMKKIMMMMMNADNANNNQIAGFCNTVDSEIFART